MRTFFLSLLFCFVVSCAVAAPMLPVPEVDIEGLIAVISWNPQVTEKGVYGMSGSLGGDRTFPAHYQVELVDCNVSFSSGENDDPGSWQHFKTGRHEKYSLTLNHPQDDGFLKPGMRIKVIGYNRSGDEGGIWTSFKKIEFLTSVKCPLEEGEGKTVVDVLAVPDTSGPEPREDGLSVDIQD